MSRHDKYALAEDGLYMGVYLPRIPPPLAEELSWRQLWRAGAFAQLDLIWDTNFSGRAKERGMDLGIGQQRLDCLDAERE